MQSVYFLAPLDWVSMFINMKKSIQRIILLTVELFAYVNRFGFYIKPSPGQFICDDVSSESYLILFFKMKRKNEKGLKLYFH